MNFNFNLFIFKVQDNTFAVVNGGNSGNNLTFWTHDMRRFINSHRRFSLRWFCLPNLMQSNINVTVHYDSLLRVALLKRILQSTLSPKACQNVIGVKASLVISGTIAFQSHMTGKVMIIAHRTMMPMLRAIAL